MTDFDAINVIRSNRSLLRRRKFKDVKNLVIETSGKTVLEFKQVSPAELATVRSKIRKKAKKTAEYEITIYGFYAIFLLLFAGYLFLQIINITF